MYCSEHSRVKRSIDQIEYSVLYCRSWSCATCQPKRRAQLVAQAVRGTPNTFITLTLPSHWAARPDEAVKELSRAWRIIRKRDARRRNAKPVPFIAVVELQKNGTPHLHILCRAKWIDQKWLSECMTELLEAPIVDIRRIDNIGRVGAYVSKYMAKEPRKVGSNKRYWQSRDYALSKRPAAPPLPAGWWFERSEPHRVEAIASDHRRMGNLVEWLGPGEVRITFAGTEAFDIALSERAQ